MAWHTSRDEFSFRGWCDSLICLLEVGFKLATLRPVEQRIWIIREGTGDEALFFYVFHHLPEVGGPIIHVHFHSM